MDPAGEKTVHSEFQREPVDEFDDEDFLAKEAEAVLPKSRPWSARGAAGRS